MQITEFLNRYGLMPEAIDGPGCLARLLEKMEEGLAGRGNIPMLPSYLSVDTKPVAGVPCCVLDAGGTNLRRARAVFREDGSCDMTAFAKSPMPGTQGELSFDAFYGALAGQVRATGCPERVGLCFSYNVAQERDLDGILLAWCKEVRVPEAPGKAVGASLKAAVGPECETVRVLNDSTAALLGAHAADPEITLGLILGTGINICYSERCANIPKVPRDLRGESMIVSTEIGEFDGFPKSVFDRAVIEASDDPALAHAEKQCAGAYLGDVISHAWQAAAREGLIPTQFAAPMALPQLSEYLDSQPGTGAARIAKTLVCRAAKIAAVLTAGPILKSHTSGQQCKLIIEGSQYTRLTGFAEAFNRELETLLAPYDIRFSVLQMENSCLLGAAIAAFAQPM